MEATYSQTPAELVFPPQVPFSWTLRSARARRLEAAKPKTAPIDYLIRGSAVGAKELAAAITFCRQHDARLELD